jgi:hypothetical protein
MSVNFHFKSFQKDHLQIFNERFILEMQIIFHFYDVCEPRKLAALMTLP